jgi:hypothetical protein
MDWKEFFKNAELLRVEFPQSEFLDQGGELLFTSPIVFEYYQRIAHELLDTPKMTTLGVLIAVCMPAFSPEWGLVIERIPPKLVLRIPGNNPIWPMHETRPIQRFEADIEAQDYAALQRIWSKTLDGVGRSPHGWRGHDGVTFTFAEVERAKSLTVGQTWCPDPATDPGRLSNLAIALKEYVLADPVARPQLKKRIDQLILDFHCT